MFSVCQSIRHWIMGPECGASTGAGAPCSLLQWSRWFYLRQCGGEMRQTPAQTPATDHHNAPSSAGGGWCLVSAHHRCKVVTGCGNIWCASHKMLLGSLELGNWRHALIWPTNEWPFPTGNSWWLRSLSSFIRLRNDLMENGEDIWTSGN